MGAYGQSSRLDKLREKHPITLPWEGKRFSMSATAIRTIKLPSGEAILVLG